jgi:copper chaperone CopZ
VEKALKKVSSVKQVTVNFDQAEAKVKLSPSFDKPEELIHVVENTGYRATLKDQ